MTFYSIEQLTGTLLGYGFEFVDSTLFTCVLEKISIAEDDNEKIKLNDPRYSIYLFNKYITIDNASFTLKDGYTLETDIGDGEYYYPLGYALKDKDLSEIIDSLDFEEIIIKKAERLGISSFQEIQNHQFFSNKEKLIMKALDDIERKYTRKNN